LHVPCYGVCKHAVAVILAYLLDDLENGKGVLGAVTDDVQFLLLGDKHRYPDKDADLMIKV